MIDLYLTDRVDIVSIATDEWGVPTESIQANVKARVEDTNQIVRNQNGAEVTSNTFIILDKDAVIDYDSKIIIRKKAGQTFVYDLRMAILKLGRRHSFELTHWEVYL